jgi:hypothetical protein|tara:strand:- start:80 stop:499 length:420 start_codon:yes stop_codon:yes gene_type:complete
MSLAFGALALFFLGLLIFKAHQYKKEQRKIADMLHEEANKLVEHMRQKYDPTIDDSDEVFDTSLNKLLSDPRYLTTLVTVLVKSAGGEVRLDEDDFLELSTDHYVSVYVDTTSNSILLRLNSIAPSLIFEDDEDEPIYH